MRKKCLLNIKFKLSKAALCLLSPFFYSYSNQIPAVFQSQQTSWSQILRTLRPCTEWYSFVLVGVVWSVCQAEAPLHPSLLLNYLCWRLLLLCLLWLALGGCIHVLRCCLWPGHKQVGETAS